MDGKKDREDENEPVHCLARIYIRSQPIQNQILCIYRLQIENYSRDKHYKLIEAQCDHEFEAALDKFLVRVDARVAPDGHT